MYKVVYLPVEIKKREFTAKILLATELVKRGFKVIIGSHSRVREMAASGISGILFDKDSTLAQKEIYKRIIMQESKIYSQDEELLIPTSDLSKEENIITNRASDEMADYLSGVFLSGLGYATIFKSKLPKLFEKASIVGNTRLDLLGGNARYYYGKKSEQLKKNYGNYILCNSTFVNVTEHAIEMLEHVSKRKVSGEERKQYEKHNKYLDENRKCYVETLLRISREYGKKIVIRLHPVEKFDKWEQLIGSSDYITITKEGDANAWIYGADYIIHAGCTTAMEAYFMHKKSILYLPVYQEEYCSQFFMDISDVAFTDEDVDKLIRQYENKEESDDIYFSEKRERNVEKYIYRNKEKLTVEQIADVFEDNEFETFDSSSVFKTKLKSRLGILYYGIKSLKKTRQVIKFEFTSAREVQKLIDASKCVLHTSKEIKVKNLATNVFLIQ